MTVNPSGLVAAVSISPYLVLNKTKCICNFNSSRKQWDNERQARHDGVLNFSIVKTSDLIGLNTNISKKAWYYTAKSMLFKPCKFIGHLLEIFNFQFPRFWRFLSVDESYPSSCMDDYFNFIKLERV